jgi:flagellar hook assembly protein FlgD
MAFKAEDIRFNERWGEKQAGWAKPFEPKASLLYYVGKQVPEIVVEIYDEKKALVRKLTSKGTAGFHTLTWDLKMAESAKAPAAKKSKGTHSAVTPATLKYAGKGKYTLKFIHGTESSEVTMEIK